MDCDKSRSISGTRVVSFILLSTLQRCLFSPVIFSCLFFSSLRKPFSSLKPLTSFSFLPLPALFRCPSFSPPPVRVLSLRLPSNLSPLTPPHLGLSLPPDLSPHQSGSPIAVQLRSQNNQFRKCKEQKGLSLPCKKSKKEYTLTFLP